MKWIFLAAILLGVPLLTALFRSKPRSIVPACFALGAGMFLLSPTLWTALDPWPAWPGYDKGFELSFVDSFSLAFILSTKPVRTPWLVKIPFALFCIALLVSTSMAYQKVPAAFYIWQLLRSVLLFVAIARVTVAHRAAPISLFAGLSVGFVYEAIFAAYQYASGVARPGGNLGHSNFLGMTAHFVTFPVFALLLGTRRLLWPSILFVAALMVSVFGESRATMGLIVIGVLLTVVLSLVQSRTSRKLLAASTIAFALLFALPVMKWAVSQRPSQALISSDAERAAMRSAAGMIAADHPLGIGANQYVIVANTGGYSQRAGVAWNEDSRAAPVHNTYYLVAAELGLPGLFGFMSVLVSFLLLGAQVLRRGFSYEATALVPGLIAAIFAAAVHMYFEWVFMGFLPHYLFAIVAGTMVAIAVRTNAQVTQETRVRRNDLLQTQVGWTESGAVV